MPLSSFSSSLPSIRDIFPEYIAHMSQADDSTQGPLGRRRSEHRRSATRSNSSHSQNSLSRQDSSAEQEQHFGRFYTSSSTSMSSRPGVPPLVSDHYLPDIDGQGLSPAYSFNILRSDPHTSSLEHVASSTTLRNRPPMSAQHASPAHTGGASSSFWVNLLPAESRNPEAQSMPISVNPFSDEGLPRHGRARHSSQPDANYYSRPHPPESRSQTSPSIISFSLEPTVGASSTMTNDGRRISSRETDLNPRSSARGEGRGKKHKCPECSKSFNRPSSLSIHSHIHSGKKPYPCPFPGCGREFNVKSNMNRHWRNHTRSGSLRPPFQSIEPDDPRQMQTSDLVDHMDIPRSGDTPISPLTTSATISEEDFDHDELSDDEIQYAMDLDVKEEEDGSGEQMLRNLRASSPDSGVSQPRSRSHFPSGPSQANNSEQNTRSTSSSYPPPPLHPSRSASIYTPSNPAYARSLTDSRVSTILRPAFGSDTHTTSQRSRGVSRNAPSHTR